MLSIRDALPEDESAWRELWAGYCAFYQTEVSEEITCATWRRILDPQSSIGCRLVLEAKQVIGFATHVLHEGTWVTRPICYLEDLFVTPASRGQGAGQALIDDLLQLARQHGWSRLYWHTRQDNPARVLYDRFNAADDFVRYRLDLA